MSILYKETLTDRSRSPSEKRTVCLEEVSTVNGSRYILNLAIWTYDDTDYEYRLVRDSETLLRPCSRETAIRQAISAIDN